ncbi:alpha/beta-hydrolase [Ophiobolus disseminans]|uniref:Alpha/beta-hydrolase n=1 Tax=Ophiobolus disseminans TaxID=1469910 RepID=A0A6A6ZQQ5_9PLEO|nr:alpha/beta-hydrolase [Ophiobolus disseminans]
MFNFLTSSPTANLPPTHPPDPTKLTLNPNETLTLTLADGRTLSYATHGSTTSSAPVIFLFHGMPGSRICGRSFDSVCQKVGARLICPDRPGCGSSTFAPRTLAQWPEDVLALADHLLIQKFSIVGASGGAPFALAFARYIPKERLQRTTLVCGIGPTESLPYLNWRLMGLTSFLLKHFATHFLIPALLGPYINKDAAGLKRTLEDQCTTPKEKALISENGEDGTSLDDAVLQYLEAFKQGSRGCVHDGGLLAREWGFRVDGIDGERVWLVHGDRDTHAPVAMARWVDGRLGGGRLRVVQGGTHFTVWKECGEEVFRWTAGL